LANQYGWKVGDHIPLMSGTAQLSGPTDWANAALTWKKIQASGVDRTRKSAPISLATTSLKPSGAGSGCRRVGVVMVLCNNGRRHKTARRNRDPRISVRRQPQWVEHSTARHRLGPGRRYDCPRSRALGKTRRVAACFPISMRS